jgi:hypothetical protein
MSTLLKVGLMSVGQMSVGHSSVAEKSRHPTCYFFVLISTLTYENKFNPDLNISYIIVLRSCICSVIIKLLAFSRCRWGVYDKTLGFEFESRSLAPLIIKCYKKVYVYCDF